jgi:uncharacterized protein DUF4340
MRGLKSTIALLVLLVGLGGYIYFVTWKKTDSSSAPKKDAVFAGLEAGQIDELTVTSTRGEVTALKKTADKWQIVKPVETEAAESDVSVVTSAIGQMEINRVVDDKPADLKEYGLDPPRFQVEFKANGGKTSGKVIIGDKTVTPGNLYAKKNDEPRVFLVADYLEGSLNKTTFDLRDKAIVKLERDKVDSLELNTGGKPMQFAKKGSEWAVVQPIAARADYSAVDGLVGRVETAQMKSIVTDDPKPEDLKKYGLDKPAATVTIGQGSARAVLAVGGASGTDAVYARDMSKPLVVTVDKTLADDLKKGVEDFRRKDAFEFRAFNATNAEFTRGDQKVSFERVKGKGENATDAWKRTAPSAADSDKSKVESLLAGLADIRATTFTDSLARTGLDKPVLTVFVKFDDGQKEERVSFGRNGSDAYALIAGQPGAGKIEAEKLDEALKALDELSK